MRRLVGVSKGVPSKYYLVPMFDCAHTCLGSSGESRSLDMMQLTFEVLGLVTREKWMNW